MMLVCSLNMFLFKILRETLWLRHAAVNLGVASAKVIAAVLTILRLRPNFSKQVHFAVIPFQFFYYAPPTSRPQLCAKK
jgi:hypothetical protein